MTYIKTERTNFHTFDSLRFLSFLLVFYAIPPFLKIIYSIIFLNKRGIGIF
jgi:hypothetical protein